MSKNLVPEAKEGLARFKMETANELGVQFTEYNGNLTSASEIGRAQTMFRHGVADISTKYLRR
jgi:small acid-soluble spore protein alpha/beta type